MSSGRGRGRGKGRIDFTKPADPAFLRRLKEQIGYKDGPSIDTKREVLPPSSEENDERKTEDDERPTVVTLKPGDLTQEEANVIFDEDSESVAKDSKVIFKKPVKRPAEDGKGEKSIIDDQKKLKESTGKKVQNKSLLSFDDEEDDDE